MSLYETNNLVSAMQLMYFLSEIGAYDGAHPERNSSMRVKQLFIHACSYMSQHSCLSI